MPDLSSREDVGSSNNKTCGFRTNALAMHSLCCLRWGSLLIRPINNKNFGVNPIFNINMKGEID